MEYPHQQYLQYQQQQRGPHVRPHHTADGDPRGTRATMQTLHAGTGDNERPMTASSGREAAVESLQELAQCSREEALYYLAEHNYDVHRAMAARTADVRWELQHGSALPRPAPELQQPQQTVSQVDPSLQAQLEEARLRLRTRYERETGDTSSSPGALALPLQQPQPTLATAPPAAQPPPVQAAASAPPLVYFPSPAAGAPPQYAAPHFPAQQAQPYTPSTTYLPPPAQTSAPSHHYPQPQHVWEEASREEANINAGTARRENPLTVAGQTLGRWIWGGTHHKDKSGSSTSSSSTSTSTSTSPSPTTTSTTLVGPPAPLQSSVSSSAFYPTTNSVLEERPGLGMGRRYQSDDSLEINELARDRRSHNGRRAEGTARDEEASTEEREGESRGGLRHLLSSVRHRGREIVDRIEHRHHQASTSGGEPQQLAPASEEEELESRRGHRRRSSHSSGGGSSAGKREKRASLDEGWVLVDNNSTSSTHPPQPTLATQVPLTDEQYAARLSRQLAEEEERQRRRDEELARRIQRQEEEDVRRRAREAEEAEQRGTTRSSGRSRRRSHGPMQVVVSRGRFGEVLVTEGLSPSTLIIDEPRGRRRRTGGLVGLLEMMREIHEMSLAQNMSQESGYPFVLAPNASTSSHRQDMTYEQLLGLAERVGNVNRGVSHAAMDALPTRTFQDKDRKADQEDNKCTICLCDYEEGDTLRTLPCLHSYHKDCIDHWLKSHNTCPVCKTQINM